jgi:predicted enzyme related to lactoylglutathione lyase
MPPGQLAHVRLAVRDAQRAARFYARCFDWQVVAADPDGLRFVAPGGLEGSFWVGGEPSSAGPELYVEVVEIDVVVRRALEAGGARIARVGSGPGGARVAQLLDPEGNRICVWEAPAGRDGMFSTPPGKFR